jgi:S-adenosylmethionine:tRNA ribosyltransferase-isomerase
VFAARPARWPRPPPALHFDEPLLAALAPRACSARGHAARGRRHLPAGARENLAEHRMHSEWFEVAPTTVAARIATHARARRPRGGGGHDHAARAGIGRARRRAPAALHGETDIFITPGFDFRVVDRLVTNFHLPKSTLMMLVSAFAGHAHVMALYRHAVERATASSATATRCCWQRQPAEAARRGAPATIRRMLTSNCWTEGQARRGR